MAPIPPEPAYPPEAAFADLQTWYNTQEQLAQLRNMEAALRKKLAAYYFPAATEGTNKLPLGNGYELVLVQKITRNVDAAALDSIKQGDIKKYKLDMDALFAFKPQLMTAAYRKLNDTQRTFIDALLDAKPGMPAMEIKAIETQDAPPPTEVEQQQPPAKRKRTAAKAASKRARK